MKNVATSDFSCEVMVTIYITCASFENWYKTRSEHIFNSSQA